MELISNILNQNKRDICLKTVNRKISYGSLRDSVKRMCENIPNRQLALLVFSQDEFSIAFYLFCLTTKIPVILLDSNTKDINVLKIANRFCVQIIASPHPIITQKYSLTYNEGTLFVYCENSNQTLKIADDLAILISTSGSINSAKFVKLTYDNIDVNTLQILQYLPINNKSVSAPPPPLSYVYGLSVLNTHLSAGGCVSLFDGGVLTHEYLEFVANIGATNINGVPYYYEIMAKVGLFSKLKNKPDFITQAGGRIKDDTLNYLLKIMSGNNIYIMYGQSEATARMTYLPPHDCIRKKGSVGIAVPGGNISIDNGEVIYKGKNIFNGYADDRKSLSYLEKIDELHTGDLGYLDDDGYLYLLGRKSRFVKISGIRISLDACESILSKIGIDCAIVGKDDKIKVYTIDNIDETEIYNTLDITPISCEIEHVLEIPRTSNGKINYAELNRLFWKQESI